MRQRNTTRLSDADVTTLSKLPFFVLESTVLRVCLGWYSYKVLSLLFSAWLIRNRNLLLSSMVEANLIDVLQRFEAQIRDLTILFAIYSVWR